MVSAWDAAADRDLLLAIIQDGKLQALDWRSIASQMAVKGYTFTHEACRYANILPFVNFPLDLTEISLKAC
jgi:hypothetical protein